MCLYDIHSFIHVYRNTRLCQCVDERLINYLQWFVHTYFYSVIRYVTILFLSILLFSHFPVHFFFSVFIPTHLFRFSWTKRCAVKIDFCLPSAKKEKERIENENQTQRHERKKWNLYAHWDKCYREMMKNISRLFVSFFFISLFCSFPLFRYLYSYTVSTDTIWSDH